MELEEILNFEGIKLLDTDIFSANKPEGILQTVYDCRSFKDFPLERIEEEIDEIREGLVYFSRDDIFSISEVAKEIEVLLSKLNELMIFHSKFSSGNLKFLKRQHKRSNKRIERNRRGLILADMLGYADSEEPLILLNVVCKDLTKLIKTIKGKDIRASFSEEENKIYNSFLSYFLRVCEEYSLKKDFKERYGIKSHNPCDFQTDEKLISTALTLASREPTIIISCDSDMMGILRFYKNPEAYKKEFNILPEAHKKEFNPTPLKNKLLLYSDFGEGYHCECVCLPSETTLLETKV